MGWLGINGLDSIDNVVYLKMIVLLPNHQNKGIGFSAIKKVIEMLKHRHYLKLALYTDQDNYKAQACYSKIGFVIVETIIEKMTNGKKVSRYKMEYKI